MHKVPALNFIGTMLANLDNEKLSDAEFRQFIRNTVPIVEKPMIKDIANIESAKSVLKYYDKSEYAGTTPHLKALAERVYAFIEEYACISPNWSEDDESGEDKYTSPDAYELIAAANEMDRARLPSKYPFSDWGSGGYAPYISKEGRAEHDAILKEIKELINKK